MLLHLLSNIGAQQQDHSGVEKNISKTVKKRRNLSTGKRIGLVSAENTTLGSADMNTYLI